MKNRNFVSLLLLLVFALPVFASNGPPPPGYRVEKQPDRNDAIVAPQDDPQYAPAPPPPPPPPPPNARLDQLGDLIRISKKSAVGIGETATFKVVFEVKRQHLNLVDVNKYPYHIDFATKVLGYAGPIVEFNKNYDGELKNREFVLGSVVLLKNANVPRGYQALFELWSGDTLDANGIKVVMNSIQNVLPKEIKILFHPLSTDHEKLAATTFDRADYVTTRDLIGQREYLVFNSADAYGYLRFASTAPGVEDAFDLTTIAVYDKVPNEIGLVGGVITAEPQTPLSHVNVKSMNRNTMNIYMHNARTVLKDYENKPVKITLGSDGPVITLLTPAEADAKIAAFWKTRRPHLNGKPLSVIDPAYKDSFVPLFSHYKTLPNKQIHSAMIQRVGAKAANLGLLNLLTRQLNRADVTSPDTLGVPFNFYDDFMTFKQAGLDPKNPSAISTPLEEVKKILAQYDLLNPNIIHPISKVREGLLAAKAVYTLAQVPPALLKIFKRYILDDKASPVHISKYPRLRLRSSTNSEDLDGFTGAGLYDSDGVSLYKKRADGTYDRTQPLTWTEIESKLKKVLPFLYSSVWNERAYQEREWYQMNGLQHLDIKVGLAFHSAFPMKDFDGLAESANGVAVTTNIYDTSDWGKVYINGQHYDLSVTNPPASEDLIELGESPDKPYSTEELLVTTFTADDTLNENPDNWKRWPVENRATSSIKSGEAVLKGDETLRLSHVLWKMNQSLARVYGKTADKFPIDVEWKVYGPNRVLMIKQARPLATTPK